MRMLTDLSEWTFINEPVSDRSSMHFTYQPTSRSPYYLRCFFFLVFRASLRSRCEAEPHQQTRERTGATVTEQIIFSATDAALSSATQRLPLLDVWKARIISSKNIRYLEDNIFPGM